LRKLLLGFDRYCANVGPGAMPRSVHDICFEMRRAGTPEQRSVWNDAAAVLHADPMAQVEIAGPPRPPPPPQRAPASYQLPHVREALERRAAAEARAQEPPPGTFMPPRAAGANADRTLGCTSAP
jgi:hypothetical protein